MATTLVLSLYPLRLAGTSGPSENVLVFGGRPGEPMGDQRGGAPGADRPDDELSRQLFAELHALAEQWMRGQRRNDHTLQASALVNEAYLRLRDSLGLAREERVRFLALASRAMRSVLVDHARARCSQKRTPPGERVPLDELLIAYEEGAVDMLLLDEALERLTKFDPEMARAVELRFFGGLSMAEIAEQLGLPARSFDRRWQAARAWLRAEVG